MTPILRVIFRKIILLLIIFLLFSIAFIFLQKFLIKKLNSAIEERNNILKSLQINSQRQAMSSQINTKIREIENKYKINFLEFKNNLITQANISREEIKNKIINLAKENNLNLNLIEEQSGSGILKFSLIGNFDDLKKFESMLRENKIKAKLQAFRVLRQQNNYLFELEILIF